MYWSLNNNKINDLDRANQFPSEKLKIHKIFFLHYLITSHQVSAITTEPPASALLTDLSFHFRFKMGLHFGELAKIRGIVIHKISPYEQKAFAGAISKGFPNTIRRIRGQIFIVTPRKLWALTPSLT